MDSCIYFVCKECGCKVISGPINNSDWDFWISCTNEECSHYEGEGWFQIEPEWVGERCEESMDGGRNRGKQKKGSGIKKEIKLVLINKGEQQ